MLLLCRKIVRISKNWKIVSFKSLKRPPEPNSCTPKMKATGLSDTSKHPYYPTKSYNLEGCRLNNTHREGLWVSPLKLFPSFEKKYFRMSV